VDLAVAAYGHGQATRRTRVVGGVPPDAVVDAVVARLGVGLLAVTAERTEFARLGALVVFGFVGVVVPVVALFVGGDDAVAAYGTAHGPGEVEVLELEPVVGLAPV